jgi:hypothetical protein
MDPDDPKTRKALAVALDRAVEAGVDPTDLEPSKPD